MASSQTIDKSIVEGSNNPVSSGAVYDKFASGYSASPFESLETGWISSSSFSYWWGRISFINVSLVIIPSAMDFTAHSHVKIGRLSGTAITFAGGTPFPTTCLWTTQSPPNMVYLVINENKEMYLHPITSFSANPGTYFQGSMTMYQMSMGL